MKIFINSNIPPGNQPFSLKFFNIHWNFPLISSTGDYTPNHCFLVFKEMLCLTKLK